MGDLGQAETATLPGVVAEGVSLPTTSHEPSDATHNAAEDEFAYPFPTDFKLREQTIDETRKLKVAVIGAGLAGITAGALLPIKVPGIQLTIFEKNKDVGGTWLENIYPGVRCDIPSHCYQSTFSPKSDWSEEYAQGREIRDYWQSVARKHDVYSKVRFETNVQAAQWHADKAKWILSISTAGQIETEDIEFDYLITANGRFNAWKLPDYPGIESFKGVLRHSSNWDPEFDPTGKRIATIGNGASGIQVTTALQKIAGHVDHYARNKTWIAGSFNPAVKERQHVAMPIPEEQLKEFKDPEKYLAHRKGLEGNFFRNFEAMLRDSHVTITSREKFTELMRSRLGGNTELLDKIVPDFPPFCRRLTPGPGYLEAITQENVDFVQTPIERFTETGIVTKDGVHREVDAVICSTGANVDFAPPFPIVAGEYDLSRDWRPEGKFTFPYTYIGIVPHGAEIQVTYIAKVLRKLSSQNIRTITPSKRAADDFLEYCDAFFPRTNMSRNCSSWYNGGRPGARIHGVWPGSSAHLARVLREPRWEDFEYTYIETENRFAYFGPGYTRKERDEDADLTPYLRLESANDLRDLHERWWDL